MDLNRPKLIVFASGTETSGGSGFETLVTATQDGKLWVTIVAVVSNHEYGGVRERAQRLKVPFVHFTPPWDALAYQAIIRAHKAEWMALSGWLKLVVGLDPRRAFNIHPGPLPRFGGKGMHGHHVHEAVLDAFKRGEITHSAVSMHFVTEEYDQGPVFFQYPVPIYPHDTADLLGARVNRCEHEWQPQITNLVIHEQIRWDGKDPKSLVVPEGYQFKAA